MIFNEVSLDTAKAIMIILDGDEQMEQMMQYIKDNPTATEDMLLEKALEISEEDGETQD